MDKKNYEEEKFHQPDEQKKDLSPYYHFIPITEGDIEGSYSFNSLKRKVCGFLENYKDNGYTVAMVQRIFKVSGGYVSKALKELIDEGCVRRFKLTPEAKKKAPLSYRRQLGRAFVYQFIPHKER